LRLKIYETGFDLLQVLDVSGHVSEFDSDLFAHNRILIQISNFRVESLVVLSYFVTNGNWELRLPRCYHIFGGRCNSVAYNVHFCSQALFHHKTNNIRYSDTRYPTLVILLSTYCLASAFASRRMSLGNFGAAVQPAQRRKWNTGGRLKVQGHWMAIRSGSQGA